MFGGVKGLEAAVEVDDKLEASDPKELFDSYLNTCPVQGSGTIRTEVIATWDALDVVTVIMLVEVMVDARMAWGIYKTNLFLDILMNSYFVFCWIYVLVYNNLHNEIT